MTKMQQVRELLQKRGAVRSSELQARGLPCVYLSRLEKAGEVVRIAPGVFVSASTTVSNLASYEQVATVAPNAIFCLLSALKFHGLTVENPHRLHVAIPAHSHFPKSALPITVYYFNEQAYATGIEAHGLIRVYSVAKTVVDCFRFRNRIGLDVARMALREALEQKRVSPNELWEMATRFRMVNLMRPYMEFFV